MYRRKSKLSTKQTSNATMYAFVLSLQILITILLLLLKKENRFDTIFYIFFLLFNMPSYLFSKQQEKLERSPFLIQKSTIILVKEEGAEKFGEKEEYK